MGRRSDPETGAIYHLTFRPPPEDVLHRLVQRSDDTEEMVRLLLFLTYCCLTAVGSGPNQALLLQRENVGQLLIKTRSWAQAVNRLQTYHNNVNSVLDFYRDILVEVRGARQPCCRAVASMSGT